MTWRDPHSKHAPNSLDAPASTLTGFDLAVHTEILRRLYDKPRPMGPLQEREQRVVDAVDAAERMASAPSNVVPFPVRVSEMERE